MLTGTRQRVVIVEDNRAAADSLGRLLDMAGYEVKVAYDGPDGVRLAEQWPPHFVLCDIGLPGGMDGYAVARALRADPALAPVFLIAATGYGQAEDQRRAREAGFDHHLTKPVDPAELQRLLGALPARA